MAFQNYKPWLGITGSEFVGLDNFKQIFEFKESYQAIINTFIIAVSKMVLGLIFPIIVALLLNEVHNMGVKKGIQTLVYLPHFLSWVTVAGMLRDILGMDGIAVSYTHLDVYKRQVYQKIQKESMQKGRRSMYIAEKTRYENMKYNRCGASGLKLPVVSLGLWHNFGTNGNFDTMMSMCETAFDNGITHFDLANNYGPVPGLSLIHI